jgi:hypothetical protein
MIFNSAHFAIFFLAVFTMYWLIPSRLKPILLLGASYVFYSWYYPPYLALIAVLSLVNYSGGIAIDKATRAGSGW